jgi:integrase
VEINRSAIGQVFRYAVATSRAQGDPTGALRGAIAAPTVRHRAAITDSVEFGHLLRALPEYQGAPETVAALKMIPLVFVRPGELRAAEWAEFDLDRSVWIIPAEKMKMRQPHRIPLAAQTLAILRDLHALTGDGKYLFPSIRSRTRCMSENTINAALRRLGFTSAIMTGHGFRSSASSLLNESGIWGPDVIERQLAHLDENKIRCRATIRMRTARQTG